MVAQRKDPDPTHAWWYNTRTGEIEYGENLSRAIDRLGPYPDEASARRALEIARERTRQADREDAEWEGEGRDTEKPDE